MRTKLTQPPTTNGGTVLTNEEVQRQANEAEAGCDPSRVRRVFRASLDGGRRYSSHVSFRAPAELRATAGARAAREGKAVSRLVREAFEKYAAG